MWIKLHYSKSHLQNMPNYPFLWLLYQAKDLSFIISLDKEFSPYNEGHFVELEILHLLI
jgi:hypothetical protein